MTAWSCAIAGAFLAVVSLAIYTPSLVREVLAWVQKDNA
jgi:hypothetical protein